MDVIYSAISRRHDMTKICSHFTYLQFVSKKWDSAHENVGGSGSGKCLLCQRLVHQSRHEVTPPVDHGCPFFFMSSHWSLRRRDQGGHPSFVSSLLRLQIGSGLLDQFKSCFLVIGYTSASLAVGRGARVTLEGREAETLWACSSLLS